MAAARQRWKADQAQLDAKRLVFVDETGTSTKMVRTHGRCRRGQRLIGKAPCGTLEDHHLHGRAALRRARRTFRPGRADERRSLPGLCREGAGAELVGRRHRRDRQPVGSQSRRRSRRDRGQAAPSFSTCRPIRPISIRSRWRSPSSRRCCARLPREPSDALWDAIADVLNAFTPDECANYLAHAGYASS